MTIDAARAGKHIYLEKPLCLTIPEVYDVVDEVKKSGIKEGMALVPAMHITAGVYVNDAESGLIQDIDQWLDGRVE